MLVSVKHKKLLLNLREPGRVTTVIPSAKTIQYKGRTVVVVPHRLDEVRVLRNLGFDAPAPISSYYDWPGLYKPFAHQRICAEFLTTNPRSYNLSGMGSGKTITTLWAFDYLRKAGLVKRMLVISPLSTLERAWGDEIYKHFPNMTFAVLHGSRERRHKLLAADFDVYIINHDGIKSKETLELLAKREGLDVVTIDEIASFRNASTERWKALNLLCNGREKLGFKPKEWVWGLTGTPIPNAPTDAWAQVRIVNPGRVAKYFGHFQDTVMKKITAFKWAPRDGALEIVREAMQPAVRFAREDCIDLPPTTYVTRQTELTPDQKIAFDEMLRKFKTEHEGGQITAVNEAVKLSKLLQICCGSVIGTTGDIAIPARHRVELVREIIEESEAKVLVFVPLTAPLKALADELGKDFSVAVVHGETPRGQRDAIFKEFQNSPNPRVIVANPGTLQHGLTLTAADTIIWFAPVHSNEAWDQANARITRPGQKRPTLIVSIQATALERKIYERLATKGRVQGTLLEVINNDTKESAQRRKS